MTKSKTDKHLTLSYKKTISKSDLHPLKGVGNGKIDVFKELTRRGPFELRGQGKNKQITFDQIQDSSHCPTKKLSPKVTYTPLRG